MQYKSRKNSSKDAAREARGLRRQTAALLQQYKEGVEWIRPGMRVMDYGSGSGELAALYAQMVGPEGSVLGVDCCKSLLLGCQNRFKQVRNLSFLHIPAHGLSRAMSRGTLVKESYDVIQARWVFHHIPEEQHVERLRELMSLLKRGGMIRLEELDRRDFRISPDFPGWTKIEVEVNRAHIRKGGAPFIGWNIGHLLRQAGLAEVTESHIRFEEPVTRESRQRFLLPLTPMQREKAEKLRLQAVKWWMKNGAVNHGAHHLAIGYKR